MKITCFIPFGSENETKATVRELRSSALIAKIFLIGSEKALFDVEGAEWLYTDSMTSGSAIQTIAAQGRSEYMLLYTRHSPLKLSQFALERFVQIAEDTGSGMLYSNYLAVKSGIPEVNPVIDYQEGGLRDDFNFDVHFGFFHFGDLHFGQSLTGSLRGTQECPHCDPVFLVA